MEFAVVGWPVDEPTLRLDYRRFSYAGKFVTGNGIAVVRGKVSTEDDTVDALPDLPDGLEASEFVDDVLAAVTFNADRTDAETLWLRYLTVRRDLRASGLQLGPRLAAFISERAAEDGYKRVRIAVNNVFSYHALYKAGFGFTGRETGIAELVLERPADEPAARSTATYQDSLERFVDRTELSDAEQSFISEHADAEPPAVIPAVESADDSETVDSGVSNPQRPSE